MNRTKSLRWLNVFAAALTIFVNILANALPLNGQNTGEISDRFKVLFVPAGYVFAIWGIIYVGLIAFAVYQALPGQQANSRLERIGWLFVVGCVANCAWIFLWHYNYFSLTVVAMLILLLSLIAIYVRLDIGRAKASALERWCVDIPFSIYLGWITVATVANITDALDNLGWTGGGIAPDVWAAIMLVVALLLTLAMIAIRRDIAYSLVIIWATIGIAVKQADTALVANTAWAVAVLVALAVASVLVMGRNRRPSQASI